MRLIVETTGKFMMLDREFSVEADRPCVVKPSFLVDQWIASGKLRVIASNLLDTATDAELLSVINDCDDKNSHKQAVGYMVATFSEPSEGDEPEEVKKTSTKKPSTKKTKAEAEAAAKAEAEAAELLALEAELEAAEAAEELAKD